MTTFATRSRGSSKDAKITIERVRVPGGFYLTNPPHEGKIPNNVRQSRFHAKQLEKIEFARRPASA